MVRSGWMWLGIVVLCLGSPVLYAQNKPLDVSVTRLETTKTGKEATIHVQNNSGKYVAAFSVSLSVHHLDGSTTTVSPVILDIGYRATKDGNPKLGIPKLLRSGDSYDEEVILDNDVVNAVPTLAAVVYADRTSYGNGDSVQEIIHSRQKHAEYVAKTNPKDASAAAKYAKDDIRRQP